MKAKISVAANISALDHYMKRLFTDAEERKRIDAEFEKLVREERIAHGHYEENEFGPECP